MKIVILIGLVIIFIASFFIVLIFDRVIKPNISCITNPECPDSGVDKIRSALNGMIFVILFVFIFFMVLYIIGIAMKAEVYMA